MKKFFYGFSVCVMAVVALFFMTACNNATQIMAASITEITGAGSDNYGVRISFLEDKRLEKKSVDIQIKCSKKIDNVVIWHENQEKQSIAFAEQDKWYSLTTLICVAQNKLNQEEFEKFDQALTKTYLFNSAEKFTLTFRVVAGESQPNVQGSGNVLTGSTPISNEYVLKIN